MSFNFAFNSSFSARTLLAELSTVQRSDRFELSVYPRWYKHVALEWTVPVEWGRVFFNVYFSQVADSDFTKLNSQLIDGTFFKDTTTQEFSKNTNGFYVVEAILADKGNLAIRSDPVTSGGVNDNSGMRRFVELRSIEIQRREFWLLSRFNGVKSWLFRRKNYGKRCTVCWNPSLEQVMNERCPSCLGTSFEGGYFTPMPFYANYDPSMKKEDYAYFGRMEDVQLMAWTISMPVLRPGDIIFREKDFSMYRVLHIQPTELQGNTVRQIFALTRLSKNEVEYSLVDRDLSYPGE